MILTINTHLLLPFYLAFSIDILTVVSDLMTALSWIVLLD